MNRRLTVLVLAALVALTAALAAYAQDESVLLRFKFQPGDVMRYRLFADATGLVRMDLPMPPEAGAMPGQIPVQMKLQGEAVAKVLRVDDAGAARLRVTADSLSMDMDLMGQQFAIGIKDGKYTVTQNGEPVEWGKIPMVPGEMKIPLLQEPIEIKIGPRGEVLDLVIPGLTEMMAMMPGLSLEDMMKEQLLLPEEPLAVGQIWSDTKTENIPGMNVPVSYTVKMALNGVETWSGDRRIANIRVESVTGLQNLDLSQAMPESGMQGMPDMAGTMSMDQQLAGNMQFDATRGYMIRFDFQLNQQMSMQSTMNMPDQGSMSMGMDLQLTIKGAVAKV